VLKLLLFDLVTLEGIVKVVAFLLADLLLLLAGSWYAVWS